MEFITRHVKFKSGKVTTATKLDSVTFSKKIIKRVGGSRQHDFLKKLLKESYAAMQHDFLKKLLKESVGLI